MGGRANSMGAALHPPLIKQGALAAPVNKVGWICSTTDKNSQIFHKNPSAIVLAQHKDYKRIGEAQKAIRWALPIVPEIAY
jgi:hypothetical protein